MISRRLGKARIFLGRLEIWLVEIYETGHSCSGCWLDINNVFHHLAAHTATRWWNTLVRMD